MSIVNDNKTENAEIFNVSLTLDPDDQARLGNQTRVTVSPDVATVTIQDDDGTLWLHKSVKWNIFLPTPYSGDFLWGCNFHIFTLEW